MKKQARRLHINGDEWHYIMGVGCARVFPPNSKSCMAVVSYDDTPTDVPDRGESGYGDVGWRPGRLKAFIEKELATRRALWIAAGKPVLESRFSREGALYKVRHMIPTERLMAKWGAVLGMATGDSIKKQGKET